MLKSANFQPQWFSAPGVTIAQRLKSTNTTMADFAWEMDFSEGDAEDLIEGRCHNRPDRRTASSFARCFCNILAHSRRSISQ